MSGLVPESVTLRGDKFGAAMKPVRRRESATSASRGYPGCFGGIDMASRARPFARLRLSTLRPPGVAIRARKPWVRSRRRLCGW
jgi:hypothetical protein